MPLGASAAVVNASIMPEKSMCGFFHNHCARVSERGRGDSGKGQNCSLLLVIGKPETQSRSDGASLLKTESNGPILPSAVINWYNSFFEPGTAPFPETDDEPFLCPMLQSRCETLAPRHESIIKLSTHPTAHAASALSLAFPCPGRNLPRYRRRHKDKLPSP